MNKKVYLVIGTVYGEDGTDTFTVVSDYAVHSTIEGARKELQRVLAETDKEAREYNIPYTYDMQNDGLVITWTETEATESWIIHEKELDKAE
jgi:hypothetical protein